MALHEFARVAVVGPGALGLVFAVRLARLEDGPRVTLVDPRPDRAARLNERPLVVHAPEGRFEARVRVALRPEDEPGLVILATKAHQVRPAAEAAVPWAARATVLAIQNGLGAVGQVRRALPDATVLAGVCYQAANLVAEGEVRHVASVAVHVGYEDGPADAAVRAVASLLDAAGLRGRAGDDMPPVIWGKLLVNAAINPVAGLAGVPNGEVASRPSLAALATAIAEEGEAVARAERVTLPYASAPEATLETARATAENRCSMLADLESGRPTEVDYLNGALVRLGEARDVATPANRAIAALVRQVSDAAGGGS